MNLSIIIVSYNTKDLLLQCLKSIYKENIIKSIFEVIVVDNNSSDATCGMIKQEFPRVRLVENADNKGFTKANNQGIRISRGNYILFLNPDTVVKNNVFDKMVEFMGLHPEAGIVGPKLLYPNGSLQLSCRRFYTLRAILMRRTFLGKIFPYSKSLKNHLMTDWDHNEIHEVDWLLGACLMIRRELINQIGLLDEKYKMYFEDVDLCYRVKKAGYKIYYYSDADVIHYHRRESAQRFSKKTIWHIQSAIRFFDKHGWKF